MRREWKTILAMLLGIALLFCGAAAEETTDTSCGEGLSWTLSTEGVLTISGEGKITNAPWEAEKVKKLIIQKGVTSIGREAFSKCSEMTEAQLPDSLTSIGFCAFERCSKLKAISLPDEITNISSYAFYNCPAALVVKADSTTARTFSQAGIGFRKSGSDYDIRYTYDEEGNQTGIVLCGVDASATSFTIPEDVTEITASCFRGASKLKSLTIPSHITSLGSKVLAGYGGYVYFQGKAPAIAEDAFYNASAVAEYPHGDSSWTSVITGDYGAQKLIWRSDEKAQAKEEDKKDKSEELKPAETTNEAKQDVRTWSDPVDSYLTPLEDGSYLRVEYTGENIAVEQYSSEMELTWKKTLEMELPLWGGFFPGADYYFLVEGQNNPNEDDSVEVMRVIRYTRNWNRVDKVSVFGNNTIAPFDGGSLRMSESGDFLYIHTCHTMYKSDDGLNHQANMSYQIYVPTMTVIRQNYLVSNDAYDYVSHSFDQFVLTDGDDIVKVDHGDAYPRAVTLLKISDTAASPGYGTTTRVTLLKISGDTGDNYTGVTVGGFAASGTHYLVAGTSVDQNQFDTSRQKNLFISTVPKNDVTDEQVKLHWITSYPEGSGVYISTPQLVKVSDKQFLLLWTESESSYSENKTLKYTMLQADGTKSSEIYSADGRLSDCTPIVNGGRVVWYVTEDSASVFYLLDPSHPGNLQRAARSTWARTADGWTYYDADGKIATGWLNDKNQTYYLNASGIMQTGFQTIDQKHYLFNDDGELQKDQWYQNDQGKYYLGADGAAVTGLADVPWDDYFYNKETDEYEWTTVLDKGFFSADGLMQTGWQKSGSDSYYFDGSGRMHTGWLTDGDARYYLAEDGVMQTGFITLREKIDSWNASTESWEMTEADCTYYLDADGKMAKGIREIDGKIYFFGAYDGRMQTGWIQNDEAWYFFGTDGPAVTGLQTIPTRWRPGDTQTSFFGADGQMLTGWQTADGKQYYFEPYEGIMETGWLYTETGTYYLAEDGVMQTGLVQIQEEEYRWSESDLNYILTPVVNSYYFNADGVMQTGWQTIDNETYYFKNDGVMAAATTLFIDDAEYTFDETGKLKLPQADGWAEENGVYVYYLSGEKQTGWQQIENHWYYFDETGAMQTGLQQIGGKGYLFNEQGIMQTGWGKIAGTWYFFDSNGVMVTGWLQRGTAWYYLDSTGAMATGWRQIGGIWYYFNPGGDMKVGWLEDGGAWYFFDGSGAMQRGWLQSGTVWYYLTGSGAMATGSMVIDGAVNLFDENGIWLGYGKTGWTQENSGWYYYEGGAPATGWRSIDGVWYYFKNNGAMATGFVMIGGRWYYFQGSGAMQTEWLNRGGTWYYFREDGTMVTGWLEITHENAPSEWYWFNPDGEMATEWAEINGQWEYFSPSGVWQYTWDGN